MKNKIIFASAMLFAVIAQSQVGVNTTLPSSTLTVNGSFEAPYTSITGNYTLTNQDYQVSFTGTSNTVLTFPSKTTTNSSANDFRGRVYFIKNNSASNTLTLTTASGDFFRFGGSKANANTYSLRAGAYALITANETTGWDIGAIANAGNNSWMLNSTDLNGVINTAQQIPAGNNYTTINNSSVTVTVPTGASQSRVVLSFIGWGDTYTGAAGMGSLRFRIQQTGVSSATYNSAMMCSWAATHSNGDGVRFNFPLNYSLNNLAPGTYTFALEVVREGAAGAVGNPFQIWGVQSKADVYIKE
ncbi:hypothetical protein SAMN05421594_3497 [Chryseobacterium oleae]|uniref:DUF5017 domain-containing protein n=1 Tax=Chryseobacterium oleae TaxID=491207 RepID=A0A1I5ACJ5_CHROL|nr:hypothetical protein [Chryseobacterium oleae]SFN60205.1 hypothetical protein SAMN05421594_3497 [Chryseobacterium oleae]